MIDDIFSPDPDDPEPIAAWLAQRAAENGPGDRPESCGCPVFREELARLEALGAAVLVGEWADGSEREQQEAFP